MMMIFGWLNVKLAGRQQGPRLPSAQAIIFEPPPHNNGSEAVLLMIISIRNSTQQHFQVINFMYLFLITGNDLPL